MAPTATEIHVIPRPRPAAVKPALQHMTYVIAGDIKDPQFHAAKIITMEAAKKYPKFLSVTIKPFTRLEYLEYRQGLKKKYDSLIDTFFQSCIIEVNDKDIKTPQDFLEFVESYYQITNEKPATFYESLAQIEHREFLKSLTHKHTLVYMDITIDSKPTGRLVFELFNDICPKTAQQFLDFVTGSRSGPNNRTLSYKDTRFTRLVKNGWIQGGDMYINENEVFKGDFIPDENFIVKHEHRGMLSMVNQGPNTNYSSFMITLKPMPYFDKKFVSFGRLIDGEDVLNRMEETPTRYEKPDYMIEVLSSGILSFL